MAVRKLAKINLSQEDIDEGRAMCDKTGLFKSDNCPVWQSLRDCFTEKVYAFEVLTGAVRVFSDRYGAGKIFALPVEATDFIQDFDAGREVKPFEFVIDDHSVEEFFKPEYLIERRF